MSSRRQQLLDSAAMLFAERGFHGVSVNDIGEACGVSGPAIYKHFTGKDELLAHSLTSISERLLAEGRRRLADSDNPRLALESLIDWHVQFALTEPALIIIQEREWPNLHDDARSAVRQLQVDYLNLWVDTLSTVRPDWDRPTARAAAQAVFGLINSTPYSARIDQAEMRALLQQMALGALVPSAPQA